MYEPAPIPPRRLNPGALPAISTDDGAVMLNVGPYARGIVLTCFEMIGGVDAMSRWAKDNRTDFYTKLFPKIITKEVEISAGGGIEEIISRMGQGSHRYDETEPMDAEIIED